MVIVGLVTVIILLIRLWVRLTIVETIGAQIRVVSQRCQTSDRHQDSQKDERKNGEDFEDGENGEGDRDHSYITLPSAYMSL